MSFKIVLVEPEIPNNTGNIGRLSLASGCELHLVRPFGFELTDKRVKRAGLDYWKHVDLHIHESFEDFLDQYGDQPMAFFSSHGTQSFYQLEFEQDMFLVFGKESVGLDSSFRQKMEEKVYNIPIESEHIRSLNLANSVAVVVYEGKRQLG